MFLEYTYDVLYIFVIFTYYTWDALRILGCSYIINACSAIIFKFLWDVQRYILDCLSNIHVMIFLTYIYYVNFSFSPVICSILLLCYFFHVMLLSRLHHVSKWLWYFILFHFCFALNFIIFIYVMVFYWFIYHFYKCIVFVIIFYGHYSTMNL
jgi:hypothetical protein